MSFAQPTEVETGEFVIFREDMEIRTIAVDRTRKIRFVFVKRNYDIQDPNDTTSTTDPNEPASTDDNDNTQTSTRNADPANTDEPSRTN